MSSPNEFDFPEGFLLGIDIQEIGLAPFGYIGPLGNLSFQPGGFGGLLARALEAASISGMQQQMDMLYEEAFTPQKQELMYETAKTIAEYAKHEGIADIVYLDRSARGMRLGVHEYERLAYPDWQPTESHFLNPEMLRAPSETHSFFAFGLSMTRTARDMAKQLERSHSSLLAKKDAPVLLVDGCVHTGETLYFAKEALASNGFNDVRTLTFMDDRDSTAMAQADVVMFEDLEDPSCRPFGVDLDLVSDEDTIYSRHDKTLVGRSLSLGFRDRIRRAIQAGFESEQAG